MAVNKQTHFFFKYLKFLIPLFFAVANFAPAVHADTLTCSKVFLTSQNLETHAQTLNPELVRSVMELADNEELSQQIYDNYSVNDIATAINKRIAQHEQEAGPIFTLENGYVPIDLKSETEIIMFFWNNNFDSILRKGFLNQHQSGKSKGSFNPDMRVRIEDSFTGLKLGTSESTAQLRPKYAFLNILGTANLHEKKFDPTLQYGNIGAVLKNTVKERSTWTSGDSLINYRRGRAYDHDAQTGLTFRGTFERNSLPNFSWDHNYYEAQIYGEVDMNDVEYFLVKEKYLAGPLKVLKKPIYLIQETHRNNRLVFEKGRCLFTGEKTPLLSFGFHPPTMIKSATDLFDKFIKSAGAKESTLSH